MRKGEKHSEETKRKISIAMKGGNSTSFKKGHIKSANWIKAMKKLKGKNNPAWKGGKMIDKQGYILIRKLKHPFCNNNGYIREHRLIMEKHIGRFLKPEEIVHHKNSKVDDNRIENLKLFKNISEHCKIHPENGMKTRFKKGNFPLRWKKFKKGHIVPLSPILTPKL